MSKIIEFKKVNREKLKKQYELEDCDDALIELAEKLIQCNPGKSLSKKKEEIKHAYLKKAEEFRTGSGKSQELSDDELDSAAGGILRPEDRMKDPFEE